LGQSPRWVKPAKNGPNPAVGQSAEPQNRQSTPRDGPRPPTGNPKLFLRLSTGRPPTNAHSMSLHALRIGASREAVAHIRRECRRRLSDQLIRIRIESRLTYLAPARLAAPLFLGSETTLLAAAGVALISVAPFDAGSRAGDFAALVSPGIGSGLVPPVWRRIPCFSSRRASSFAINSGCSSRYVRALSRP